jgi:hypothetical protein
MDPSNFQDILGSVVESTLESVIDSVLKSPNTLEENRDMSAFIPWVEGWDTPMSNATESSMGTHVFDPLQANMTMPVPNSWEGRINDPVFDPWVESMDTSPEPSDTEEEEGSKRKGKGIDIAAIPSEPVLDLDFVPSFEAEELLEIGQSEVISSSQPVRSIEILSSVDYTSSVPSVSYYKSSVSRTPSASITPSVSRTASASDEPSASSSRSSALHRLRSNPRPSLRSSEDRIIQSPTPSAQVPTHGGHALKWEPWELALLMMAEDWVTLHNQRVVEWLMVSQLMELLSAVMIKKHPGLPSRRIDEMPDPYLELACCKASNLYKNKDHTATFEQLPWIVQTLAQEPDWVVFTLCLHLNHHVSDKRPYHSPTMRQHYRKARDHDFKSRRQNLHERHVVIVQQNFSYLVSCEDCRAWYNQPGVGQDPLQKEELLVLHHASTRLEDRHYPEWLKTMCNYGRPSN